MELGAILIAGARRDEMEAAGNGNQGTISETFAGIPLALLDVVGRSVVHHVSERLQRVGVEAVTAITAEVLWDAPCDGAPGACVPSRDVWQAAEDAFSALAGEGVENVLVWRLGPYAEFDVADLLGFHRERRQHATLVCGRDGALDAAVIEGSRRHDAAFLLRNRLQAVRVPAEPYLTSAYINRLQTASDLRRLAQDALLMRCGIRPAGCELKPGVWVGEHARLHRSARILAPSFVGAHAKLRAGCVVTRCSAVEHHAQVDRGTVLEDTTVLPYTYMGAGLDASHTIAGFGKVAHLRRGAEVEIQDPRLLGAVTTSAPWRMLKNAASLASYLPVQAWHGLASGGRRAQAAPPDEGELGPSLGPPGNLEPSSAPLPASNEFASDFAVVRRYGNE